MSGFGSVKQAANGTWFYVVDVPSATGERKQVRKRGFETKKAANAALKALHNAVASGVRVDPTRITVGEYLCDVWLPQIEGQVRPSTIATYKLLVETHIKPKVGAVRLQQLDRATVAAWVAGLSKAGAAGKTVRNIFGVLNKALTDAVELELIGRNVAAGLKALPPRSQPTPRAWDVEQLGVFLAGMAGDRLAAMWRFLAMTGCRRGEVMGLRWRDVDLKASTATITSQRTLAGNVVVEGAPKTAAGARTITLDEGTLAVLKSWKKSQTEERLMMGSGWQGGDDFVFTNEDGSPIYPPIVTRRFHDACERLTLPQIGVHGLRHTAATYLIGAGVNPRVVQQRLGHAHVAITLGLYTHVLPGHDREAVEALSRALG